MSGIVAFGAYVPRLRLQRQAVFAAAGWFNPALKTLAKGERAMARWDEDAVTMAVEAARDCLAGLDRGDIAKVMFASTSLPFADRQNAGIVKEALNLNDAVGTLDVTGSQRAGASALIDALQASVVSGPVLCVAAERRRARPGSEAELINGDAAAAILVGPGEPVARLVASYSITVDFVDHFRSAGEDFDYAWESRWVREEGYLKLVPAAVQGVLQKAGLKPSDIDRFIMPAPMRGVHEAVAKACGIASEAVADPLDATLGDCGAAQPLLLLARALATAKPKERLLVIGFGQGCDALVLEVVRAAPAMPDKMGVDGWLSRRKPEANYIKHLFFSGMIDLERGMRAEADQKTALTALYRNRKGVLGLVGGRCAKTGVVQFPRSEISVAQNDRAIGTQEDYPLADRRARIVTHTADSLTYTPEPPDYYGMIEFEGGGRMVTEFADVEATDVDVGKPMRMMFRIKAFDERRGFRKYFWKAVPDYLAPSGQ